VSDAPSPGRFEGSVHRLPVRVYYEDTDFTGLVYHASYVRFFERGRSDFLRLAGADHQAMAALDCAFVVLRLEVDYHRGARIDEALTVETDIAPLSGARFEVRQQIVRSGESIASARVLVACIDGQGRARRPPRALITVLAGKLAKPAG
jgi:acyl-CoA thioester hydrolase